MKVLCFLLILGPLYGQSEVARDAEPLVESSWLAGPDWSLALLANDPHQYVANRYVWHRAYISRLFSSHRGDAMLQRTGRKDPLAIGLARVLSQISTQFVMSANEPHYLKHDLLSVGFPVDELEQINLPQDASLKFRLAGANRLAAQNLPDQYHLASDQEITAYLNQLRDETWKASEAWAAFYLARFSPAARVTLVRFAGEYRVGYTHQVFYPPHPTVWIIERVRRNAQWHFQKYHWEAPGELQESPTLLMTRSGRYAEWVSAESIAAHLCEGEDFPEPSVNEWLQRLATSLPKAVERGKSLSIPADCNYVTDLKGFGRQNLSLAELVAESAGIFSGRVVASKLGFYRNHMMSANQLLTVRVEHWLRKPEGQPGNTYQVINGYVRFALGPYQLCSADNGFQDVPVGRSVLIFTPRHPLDEGERLLVMSPNQIHLMDDGETSSQNPFYGKISMPVLKSLIAAHPFVKNDPSAILP